MGNITVLEAGPRGGSVSSTLWVGSQQGLALLCVAEGCVDRWRFFAGDRWLSAGPRILSIAAAPDQSPGPSHVHSAGSTAAATAVPTPAAWVLTGPSGGLARLWSRRAVLADKAAVYTARTAALSRYRWVAAVGLREYGNQSDGAILRRDGDNDGLWTGMLVASQIFRFAATKSEEARTLAWHHFAAMEFLHNVTGTAGFIARTAVRCGDSHQGGDGTICPAGSPNSCGWVNSTACYAGVDNVTSVDSTSCCWQWKRDTSSDEVTGHFFTLLLAHELLSRTAAERVRVGRLLCATAAYLQDGGWVFVDPVTKRGTTWGYWDPAQLNGVPGKMDERGENSLEVLGYLAAAAKICDATSQPPGRFGAAFVAFVTEHAYDVNTVNAVVTAPPGLAFFDFRLAFMSYHNLVLAAPGLVVAPPTTATCRHGSASHAAAAPKGEGRRNADGVPAGIPLPPAAAARFRASLQASIRRYWDETGATVDGRNNRVAALDVVYNLMTGAAGLADPEWQLRRYPTELVDWPATNSHRRDIRLSADWASCPPALCGGSPVLEGVLPADEALARGSSDFLTEAAANSVDGGGGMVENAPNPWLLVYWMRRYYDVHPVRAMGCPTTGPV